jgi:integrase
MGFYAHGMDGGIDAGRKTLMPRSMRAPALETRTARLKLPIIGRNKPYWARIGQGIALGYRRNQGPGTWSVRVANGGRGAGHWTLLIGAADDHDAANGDSVLTFWQAQQKARNLGLAARHGGDSGGKFGTVAEALAAYESDLKLRGGDLGNVRRVRLHLPAAVASKTVATLAARDFKPWRAALLRAELSPAAINRSNSIFKAVLNHAAAHDERIGNGRAWERALASIPDAVQSRNVILDDETIRAIVTGAYRVSPEFGLLVEVAGVTGARVSQLAGLLVRDLQSARTDPRLMMPSSKKGRERKKVAHRPVPIPPALAVRLLVNAQGREAEAPLLVKPSGEPWKRADHLRLFRRAVALAELDTVEPVITLYALRHSSIVRQLLAGTPIRLVAVVHDTSVAMIEKTYSRHIADVSDVPLRRAMLDVGAPAEANVIALRREP